MTQEEPRHVLVQARREPSPLYEAPAVGWWAEDTSSFSANLALEDPALALPPDLSEALRSWSLFPFPEGGASRSDLREHVERGVAVAQRLARHLGPSWAVRYWDEHQRTMKWLCWGCDRLHWERDLHGSPPHPLDITVEGEFKYGPLRAEGFGDFFPDDPAAGLDRPNELVTALYTWARDIDDTLNRDLRDREEGKYDAEWRRLCHTGVDLARRVAHELGPARKVTYKGLANGGLDALTSVTWQGDREL
ncbi:hypothetical protein ACFY3E_15635 [Streptomyces griseorubiginosus]|uniref:hypothetical protein n=1 Tax=Streptomyces griseorubiginosus TaxID=67304 RepID=UPI0036CD53F7